MTQPPPPPPGYGYQPPPGYYPVQQTSQNATVALILAIAAWVVCPIVLAVVSLVFANKADAEIRASGGAIGGEGTVRVARIIDYVHFALWGLAIIAVIIGLVVLGSVASHTSN